MKALPKISPPVLPAVVPRTGLFRWLDQSRARPVIWVQGSPGAGKTTLVASYLKTRRLRHYWYDLDEGDADPATFFDYLGRLAETGRRGRKRLPHLTPEYLGGLPAFSRRFLRTFFAPPYRPGVLVFDNYQTVPEDAALHELLCEGLAEAGDGWNVVMISRQPAPASWARHLANRQMATLRQEQLSLSFTETRAMLTLLGGRRSGPEARRIHQRSDGWAAGVVLLTGQAGTRPRSRVRAPAGPGSEAAVFGYFAGEIFDTLPPHDRDFMMRTALLPRMTAASAAALSGNPGAGEELRRLHEHHYFTQRHAGPEFSYRYHALFRAFLLERARRALTTAELARVRSRAGALLEAEGDIESAAELFREAEDWGELARVITQQAPALMSHGRHQTLSQWLEALPGSTRTANPWVLYWAGMVAFLRDPSAGRAFLQSAYPIFKARHDAAGAFLAWSGIVDTFLHEWDDFTPLDAWIRELPALRKRFPAFSSRDIEARVATSMASALLYRMPQHPRIAWWVARASHLLEGSSDPNVAALASFNVMLYFLWTGDCAGALPIVERIRRLAKQHAGLPEIAAAGADSIFLWYTGFPEGAHAAARQGLDLAAETGVHVLDHLLLPQPIYASLASGDLDTARRCLEKMAVGIHPEHRLDFGHYHFLAGWERLETGDVESALRHVRVSLASATRLGTPFPEGLNRIAMAQVLAERGERGAALSQLTRTRRIARRMKSALLEFMAILLESHLAYHDGDGQRGEVLLRRGLTIGREHGLQTYPWWRPSMMGALCARASLARIERPYVHQLVRRLKLGSIDPPVEVEDWPWSIKVHTLGRFAIVKDGRPLKSAGKAQERPLTLLKAIVALGARDVPETQLLDALWPSIDGDRAHRAFATNLHRLRKLLGDHSSIVLTRRQVSLDSRTVWVDTWAFERLLDEAAADGPAGEQAWRAIERALTLYRGAFLAADDGERWASAMRERLRARFVEHTGRVGERLERGGEWTAAAGHYERGIEADELAEELYRRLMRCYGRAGRRAEALKVYERCRRTLGTALSIAPSPQTDAVRDAILGH